MIARALLFISLMGFLTSVGVAQAASSAMNPEALGAKALLEEMLARRFAQELATKLDRSAFTVGAQLDVTELPKKVLTLDATTAVPEPISDLMLGTLDPEDLMKRYASTSMQPQAEGFLRNYRIKTVNVAVGLKEEIEPEFKAEIEKWLTERVNAEFGKAGKSAVTFIKNAPVKKEISPKKDLLGWLSEFQSLAGQIVMALALLIGVLMWKILTSKSLASVAKTGGEGQTINVGGPSGEAAAAKKEAEADAKLKEEEDRISAARDIEQLTARLNALIPRLSKDFEAIMRAWVQMGQTGIFKLACFAEAVGKELGKLPIPVDALPEVSKVFAKMSDVKLPEKRDALQKAYWDMLSVLNLGAETLTQPFGYLGGVNVGVVNSVLMDQNPRMKTLVSFYLPNDLRSRYLQSLSLDAKRELLNSAASMSEIPAAELKSMDGALASKLKPQSSGEVVPLDMTLNKLVSALTPIEEVTLLNEMSGPAIDGYKRANASVAFLGQWPDDKLQILLSRVSPDEITALARVRPDLQERLIALAPPLTAEMAGDELRIDDRTTDDIKNEWLGALVKRINEMVRFQEINLDVMFAALNPAPKYRGTAREMTKKPLKNILTILFPAAIVAGLLVGLNAQAREYRVGAALGFGGTGIDKLIEVQGSSTSVSRSEGPGIMGFFFDTFLADSTTLGIEHSRGFRLGPFTSGLTFTGLYVNYYFMGPAPAAVNTEGTESTILYRRYNLYVGMNAGIAQGHVSREGDQVPNLSGSGAYLGFRFGADYPLTGRTGIRPELMVNSTFMASEVNAPSMSELALQVAWYYSL